MSRVPPKDRGTFLETDLVPTTNLVRPVDIRILASLAPPLCFAVEQNCGSGFGIAKEMHSLYEASHDELYPEDPKYDQQQNILQGGVQLTMVTTCVPRRTHR